MKLYFQILLVIIAIVIDTSVDSSLQTEGKNLNTRYLQQSDPQYIGCFRDATDRALSFRVPGNGNSINQCKTECESRGYKYAGRQYLGECYCGNSGYDKHGTRDDCSCDSDNVGGYRNCVYDLSTSTSSPVTTPSPTPGPTGEPGSAIYLGCFRDTTDRALSVRIPGNGKTAIQCQSECSSQGFKYAGRQYLGECYCGNSGYDKHGTRDDCSCDSDNVGGYRNCVWELFSGPLPPTTTPAPSPAPTPSPTNEAGTGGPEYLGCFQDTGSDRALSTRLNGALSLDQCVSGCYANGFKYAGRQYLGECYCGNSGYDKHGMGQCNPCDSENVGPYVSCVYDVSGGTTFPAPPTPSPVLSVPAPAGHCRASLGYSPGNHGSGAYFDYENQNNWSNIHGNTNEKIRWAKFPSNIFNFILHNQCAYNQQSPINVCDGSTGPKNENAECFEGHKIFQYSGVWRLSQSNRIEAQILGSKLRLEYATKTWGPYEICCGNGVSNPYKGWCPLIYAHPTQMCGSDLPPLADFPFHWNGYTQLNHIDFKFPSEHTICGKRYDAEITYWFAWVNRKAAINMAIMVEIGTHNNELEKVIQKFEQVNLQNRNSCARRRGLKEEDAIVYPDYESQGHFDYSNMTLSSDESGEHFETHRRLDMDHFDPFSSEIVRTEFFYGYWGTGTEPPCLGAAGNPHRFIAYRIMDTPTTMSASQLERLRQTLLTNVDQGTCQCTSVARWHNNQWSVARDLQPEAGRGIYRCRQGVDWS